MAWECVCGKTNDDSETLCDCGITKYKAIQQLSKKKFHKQSTYSHKESSTIGTDQLNKVVNVTLTGGIIGLIGVRPNNALNSRIKKENENGWKVIQIIPSSSGNLLLLILRLILLIVTLFLYTTDDGYYVIMERIEKE